MLLMVWYRHLVEVALVLNGVFNQFHVILWAIVSVLRYLFIGKISQVNLVYKSAYGAVIQLGFRLLSFASLKWYKKCNFERLGSTKWHEIFERFCELVWKALAYGVIQKCFRTFFKEGKCSTFSNPSYLLA